MIPRLLQAFWRFRYLGKSCGVGLVFNTTQKVYYTETKSTFKTFGTEIMLPLQLKKKTNHILWI